jgi:hypothetical protein
VAVDPITLGNRQIALNSEIRVVHDARFYFLLLAIPV